MTTKKHNSDTIFEHKQSADDFKKEAESTFQSIQDLIARFNRIDAAIVKSNAETMIETSCGTITVAGTGTKSSIKDVQDCLFYLGIPKIYKYGLAVQAMNWDGVAADKKIKIDKMTDKLARKLSQTCAPTVGIKTGFMFWMMGMMQKKGWNSSPVETQYWKEKGWLDGKKPWSTKKEY